MFELFVNVFSGVLIGVGVALFFVTRLSDEGDTVEDKNTEAIQVDLLPDEIKLLESCKGICADNGIRLVIQEWDDEEGQTWGGVAVCEDKWASRWLDGWLDFRKLVEHCSVGRQKENDSFRAASIEDLENRAA